jgi:hypothetical protein
VYLERTGHADRPEQLALEVANAIRSSGGDSILRQMNETRTARESE